MTKIILPPQHKPDNLNVFRDKWNLLNKILNMARLRKGLPIVPESNNPYASGNWKQHR